MTPIRLPILSYVPAPFVVDTVRLLISSLLINYKLLIIVINEDMLFILKNVWGIVSFIGKQISK